MAFIFCWIYLVFVLPHERLTKNWLNFPWIARNSAQPSRMSSVSVSGRALFEFVHLTSDQFTSFCTWELRKNIAHLQHDKEGIVALISFCLNDAKLLFFCGKQGSLHDRVWSFLRPEQRQGAESGIEGIGKKRRFGSPCAGEPSLLASGDRRRGNDRPGHNKCTAPLTLCCRSAGVSWALPSCVGFLQASKGRWWGTGLWVMIIRDLSVVHKTEDRRLGPFLYASL